MRISEHGGKNLVLLMRHAMPFHSVRENIATDVDLVLMCCFIVWLRQLGEPAV